MHTCELSDIFIRITYEYVVWRYHLQSASCRLFTYCRTMGHKLDIYYLHSTINYQHSTINYLFPHNLQAVLPVDFALANVILTTLPLQLFRPRQSFDLWYFFEPSPEHT